MGAVQWGLPKKVRPEGGEAEGHAGVWGADGGIPGRGTRKGRGPKAGVVRNR